MGKIKIDIVDDHQMILAGLKNILQVFANMEVGNLYNNGQDLLAGLKQNQPNVLLLDIQIPDINGDELASIIRTEYPEIKILVMTGFDTTYHVRRMMQKGALGYLLKNASETDLKEAIETVFAGKEYLDKEIKKKLLQETLHPERQTFTKPTLTRREKQILTLIMQEKTSQQIASSLFLSLRTVENQRVNLMQKLDVKNAVGLVKKTIEWNLLEA